ncbi:branched-chain amino acid transaminase [Patescibacteria group bacterium]|nr:branched-chain amino acid transaminase [Patescibacteria group bacterium]
MKIWFNGKFIDSKKAIVPILTHTLHYGSGAFEGIRFYKTENNSVIFRLDEHLNRLFYSCSVLSMKISYSQEEIKKAIISLIKLNKLDEGYIRPIVWYGNKMGLYPGQADVNVALAVWPWESYLGNKPIKTIISKFIRLHPKSIVADAKISGYYANSVLASLEAKNKKADEAIFLDYKGNVAEGPGENIFLVKNKKVYTPKRGSILPGITRDSVLALLKDLKIPFKEKEISPKELKFCDELFFTGTAVEICPIGKVDNTFINNGRIGEITKIVKDLYCRVVRGLEKKYLKWLNFIK